MCNKWILAPLGAMFFCICWEIGIKSVHIFATDLQCTTSCTLFAMRSIRLTMLFGLSYLK